MRIIALDFETGGLSPEYSAITQLAVVATCTAAGKATFHQSRSWAIRPATGLTLDDNALAIQGHTKATLMRRPNQLTEAVAIRALLQWVDTLGSDWETAPLVAHNAQFDHGFLQHLCQRTNTPLLERDAICTVKRHRELVAKKLAPKPEAYKLGILAPLVGMAQSSAHDATEDAKICAALFAWQEPFYEGSLLGSEEIAGRVYEHVPPAADGWWKQGPKEYPAKPVEGSAPVAVLTTEGMLAAADRLQDKIDSAPAPLPSISPNLPFAMSVDMVAMIKRARAGELPTPEGLSGVAGPIEDTNSYVLGCIRMIQRQVESLQKIQAVVGNNQ